jgi:hypothetical protein
MKKSILLGLGAVAISAASIISIRSIRDPVEARAETYSQGDVVPSGKARLWVGYDTQTPFTKNTTEMKLWIHATESGGEEHVYVLSEAGGSFNNATQGNRRYDYFDINESDYVNGWYLTVQRFQNGNWKGQTNPLKLSASNAFMVYYVWGNWAEGQTQGTVSPGSIDSVDAGLAAKALAGINTCRDSSFNGYKAFPNFESTFVKNGDNWKTVGNLSDYTINDYDHTDPSRKTAVDAYVKYVAVQNMQKSGKISGVYQIAQFGSREVNGAALTGGIAAVGLAAAGTMIFVAKRRKDI